MATWDLQTGVFVLGVALLTGIAAFTDARWWKIPNWLTLPAFVLGLVYQAIFHQWSGLGDGLAGFAIGFGTYLLLWLTAGGGGGDVKLMGALGAWLGFRLTLYVMIVSTIVVIGSTLAIMIWVATTRGTRQLQARYLATGKTNAHGTPISNINETIPQKQGRRIMAFGVPVAVSTWLVLIANDQILEVARQARADAQQQEPARAAEGADPHA